jgi:hypothetical protein
MRAPDRAMTGLARGCGARSRARCTLWNRLTLVLLLGTLAVPGACRRAAQAPPAAAPPPSESWTTVASARVYYDNAGGILDSMRVVVRDAEQLREIWARATSRQIAPPPPPEIDFAREMLLVVAAGRRSPEDQIRVDSVRVRQEIRRGIAQDLALSAVIRLHEGCGRFAHESFPLEIVRLRRIEGPVEWVERRDRSPECMRAAANRYVVGQTLTKGDS